MDAIPYISKNDFLGTTVTQEMQSTVSQFEVHNKQVTNTAVESTTTTTEIKTINNDLSTTTTETNANGVENGATNTTGAEAAPMVCGFNPKKRKLTREDIENGATAQGAAGG